MPLREKGGQGVRKGSGEGAISGGYIPETERKFVSKMGAV
jgi:hypothetical protein